MFKFDDYFLVWNIFSRKDACYLFNLVSAVKGIINPLVSDRADELMMT